MRATTKRIVHVRVGSDSYPTYDTTAGKKTISDVRRIVSKALKDAGLTKDTGLLVTNHTIKIEVHEVAVEE